MYFVAAAPFARINRVALFGLILAAFMLASAIPFAASVRAAEPAPLKAVFIVGPTNGLTDANLRDANELADEAELLGMDVRRVFWPNATWENVLANIQGANLVYYAGHGYGWPSKYTKVLTEARQNGMGLNSFAGSAKSKYTYYGANMLKQHVTLAPNAIVFLNHLCYSAGNGEAGQAIPTWDVARQRVDNMANGWLAVGAKAVFAYPQQLFVRALRQLHNTPSMTVEDIFRTTGPKPTPYYGWIGWDARKFDSVRTPGTKNFLDPHQTQGFYRAISGDLSLTGDQWRAGIDGPGAPTMNDFEAAGGVATGTTLVGGGGVPLITPNGDGISDGLAMTFRVNKESFVDFEVRNGSGNVVRNFTAWSLAGTGTAVWDGRNNGGNWAADGDYSITGRPRNRAGEEGNTRTIDVRVLTTMRAPAVSVAHFYSADGDALAPNTTFSVTLNQAATFSWKVVNQAGDTVRTRMNEQSVGAGAQSWTWDGKNDAGAYVPDGTYYSVMTAATSAGAYSHKVAVDVGAFKVNPAVAPPFVRAKMTKLFVYSAEKLNGKPKVKVTMPGLKAKTYKTVKVKAGGWFAKIKFPAGAPTGTATFTVFGFDSNGVRQETVFTFQVQ